MAVGLGVAPRPQCQGPLARAFAVPEARKRSPVAVLAILVGAALAPGGAGAGSTGSATYKGKVRFDQQATVSFVIHGDKVAFQAHDIELQCDAAPVRVRPAFGIHRTKLRHGRFEFIENSEVATTGSQSLYWFKGKLLPRGGAKGFVYAFDRGPDADGRFCSTFGKARWTATRVE